MSGLSTREGHKFWLIITSIVIWSFGPVFALGSYEPTAEPARWSLDVLSWPVDGAQSYTDPTTRFLSALTGGFLFGWGIMVLCLRQWVFDAAPEGIRKSILIGSLAWFFLDSAGSWASGNHSNLFFNVIVLLLLIGPMWWPARQPT